MELGFVSIEDFIGKLGQSVSTLEDSRQGQRTETVWIVVAQGIGQVLDHVERKTRTLIDNEDVTRRKGCCLTYHILRGEEELRIG